MRTQHEYWTIEKLSKNFNNIEFPEFQREPTIWDLEKKQKLIDSILRDFDISSLYFSRKENGGYDCIDGRKRINAIFSFLGINGKDEEDNGFHLKIENEIYDDGGYFNKVDKKRFSSFDSEWKRRFMDYRLNIVAILEAEHDEELNLLFLRLQIASILNAGEKLNAMTGDMRNWIFYTVVKHDFFNKIEIRKRRYAKEQVAAQIALNAFSKRNNGDFQRSRYIDLQDFFKRYSSFSTTDKKLTKEIENNFGVIVKYFGDKLKYVNNRAIAVSVYLFVSELIEQGKEKEIKVFVEFFIKFLRTLKWQIPKGIEMDKAYYDLLKFQTNITQAAGEKTAIQKRHDFLNEYFYFYKKEEGLIKGDKEYKQETRKDPNIERGNVKL
jgi:hypothetical protein